MSAARLRIPALLLVTLTVQSAILQGVRLAGVHPDALLLFAVAAGIAGGPERGAVVGFVTGLVADLFLQTPFGLSALTFGVVGFGVGAVQGSMIRSTWWIRPITALVACAAGVVLFALVGAVLGQAHLVGPRLVTVAGAVALTDAFLALALVPAVGWAMAAPDPARAYAK